MRKCSICGNEMSSGYYVEDGYLNENGAEYYCSDECLYSVYTEEEYQEMYEEELAYYTEWEEDDIYMGRRMNYKDLFLKIKSKLYSFKQKNRNIDLKNMYIGLSNDDFQKLIRAGSELYFYCADEKLYFMGVFISPNYELKPGEIVIGIKEKL